MKKLVTAVLVLLTLNTNVMAQHGFKVTQEITINVTAAQLWKMVGPGFVEVYKWSSSVDHATGSGAPEFEGAVCSERVCDVNVKGFTQIGEKLTKYEPLAMNIAYEVTAGMPGFMERAVNDWTVVDVDGQSARLIMQAEFEVKGLMGLMMKGMMERKMQTALQTVLNDAKIYAETGEVSQAKKDRMEYLARKQAKRAA